MEINNTITIVISVTLTASAGLLYAHELSHKEPLVLNTSQVTAPIEKPNNRSLLWKKATVKKGDTLTVVFNRLKIKQKEFIQIAKQYKPITIFYPNEISYFKIKTPYQLLAIKSPVPSIKMRMIEPEKDHSIEKFDQKQVTTTLVYKSIVIHHSLSQDAKKVGVTFKMQTELQSMFGNRINFSHGLYRGDRFELLYQVEYVDGKKYHNGNIIAAELSHHGKIYQGIRYTYAITHTAYYTPDGRGIGARFLRDPLHYTLISSRFSYYRLDPILHKIRPHLGVDFAACFGTPIKSIGEGRVVFVGRDGGYGRTVKISYDGYHYLALYAHLSRFANIKNRQWVHKGQIIGYVGESGWATGPHLHFGFFVDGKAKDWLSMTLPNDQAIPRSYEDRFRKTAKQLLAELHLHQDTKLVANNVKIKHPS